jgi:hypothetical protein
MLLIRNEELIKQRAVWAEMKTKVLVIQDGGANTENF